MKIGKNEDVSLSVVLSNLDDLFLKTLLQAWHNCRTTCENDIVVQINFEIWVALLNGSNCHLGETFAFFRFSGNQLWVEKDLGGLESLSMVHLYDLLAW